MTARPREGVEASLIPCCRTASSLVEDWGMRRGVLPPGQQTDHLLAALSGQLLLAPVAHLLT